VQDVANPGSLEELVPTDVVDVQVRVDHGRDVAEPEAAGLELPRDRLLRRLLRQLERQHAVHVVEVDARVEEEEAVVVLDQDAVDGDPDLRPGHVPHELGVLDDDRAVVEQPDLHGVFPSRALRTATSLPARCARSWSICSGV
jgi:hypothetical protein